MNVYHMINWFFMFSFFGYLLECAVLSYEYRTPVINRGFGHGPFCIIYGFGAMGACVFLQPFAAQPIKLYFATSVMATSMELLTAHMMIRLFGSFWWDYSHKPFNYKGIICLESSIAWGFLGIFFFRFLNGFVHRMVGYIPDSYGKMTALALVCFYFCDFTYTMYMQRRHQVKEEDGEQQVIGRLKVY